MAARRTTFAEACRIWCSSHNLTPKEMARSLDMDEDAYIAVEAGVRKPDPHQIVRLEHLAGVPYEKYLERCEGRA